MVDVRAGDACIAGAGCAAGRGAAEIPRQRLQCAANRRLCRLLEQGNARERRQMGQRGSRARHHELVGAGRSLPLRQGPRLPVPPACTGVGPAATRMGAHAAAERAAQGGRALVRRARRALSRRRLRRSGERGAAPSARWRTQGRRQLCPCARRQRRHRLGLDTHGFPDGPPALSPRQAADQRLQHHPQRQEHRPVSGDHRAAAEGAPARRHRPAGARFRDHARRAHGDASRQSRSAGGQRAADLHHRT
jgi:hypothetical protein